MEINKEDFEKLRELEESLWRAETRFDKKYMEQILAPDFFEFGRSGSVYTREEILAFRRSEDIDAVIPFKNFTIHLIDEKVALVTYLSEVTYGGEVEVGNRSSLWLKTVDVWKLKFHQGTAVL